jgi:uncharacterized protein YqgC (DUF456 family)
MKRRIKRLILFIIALIALLLGFVGIFLPFLQGILLLAVGLILLSILSPSVRVWMEKHTVKYPKLHSIAAKLDDWVRKVIGNV